MQSQVYLFSITQVLIHFQHSKLASECAKYTCSNSYPYIQNIVIWNPNQKIGYLREPNAPTTRHFSIFYQFLDRISSNDVCNFNSHILVI